MAMIAAGFSGGEAEELRRAFGFKRSAERMKDIEIKLRRGMDKQGIAVGTQDKIVRSITSFALYGFPESHAASFALISYASAYLKCHYLAAFTAAILNNQPMGFYSAATLVKDAQRHGLKIRPIDVTRSDWLCTLERIDGGANYPSSSSSASEKLFRENTQFAVRLGLRFVKGLRAEMASEILRQRAFCPFVSIDDLERRAPLIQQSELVTLAEVGALNFIPGKEGRFTHRRDALWQIERAARRAGPLLESADARKTDGEVEHTPNDEQDDKKNDGRKSIEAPCMLNASNVASSKSETYSPLLQMTPEERLVADFRGTGITVGPHPMAFNRRQMKKRGVRSAIELHDLPNGSQVRIAGGVIARQRPGTANGFVFLSIEDETGIANAVIPPQLFDRYHVLVVHQQFLLIDGELQNQEGVVSVKAARIRPLSITRAKTISHDFH
jgi:error-prone DNA polymerase